MSNRLRTHQYLAVAMVGSLVLMLAPRMAVQAVDTQPFSVTITHVECVDDCAATGLEAAGEGHADFYAKVFFDGVKQPPGSDVDDPSTPQENNNPSIDPFWTVSTQLPATAQKVIVTIQIWDQDDTSGDDLGDASPKDGDNNLDFVVGLVGSDAGKWLDPYTNGDNINWPQNCSTGDGGDNDEPRVKVCFDVSTLSTTGDADGDGLLDSWERYGYNDNGDGFVDVNLPAMGANPNHKDLFLELDTVAGRAPTHAGILAIKNAFAAAPLNAGSSAASRQADNGGSGVNAPPNPDGQPGITLHVDTGSVVDPTAREGAPTGTCADGIDNGGDGLIDGNDPTCIARLTNYIDASVENPGAPNCTDGVDNDGDGRVDANDPDCLVGDNLGGGNVIGPPNDCGLSPNFYTTKAANFNQNRRLIFRYAEMSARPGAPTCTGAKGGQGEIGGNDFAIFNLDAGTIMHELGHTLNLRHGGFQDSPNCKPNYVSLMNYDNQGGISRVGGGFILDYSPPRIALNGSTRGVAPLGPLVESSLTESTTLDGSDPSNRFVFVNTAGRKITNNLNTIADWDNDGIPGIVPTPPTNIDTVGLNGRPTACANGSNNETLQGSDDWTFVSLQFRQFGDSASAGVNVETDDVPTTEDLLAMYDEMNTTDVGVTKADSVDPVAAGTDLVYMLVVANHGPNPAASVKLIDSLPSQTTFVGGDPACQASNGVVTCGLGDLVAGATRSLTITVHIPSDLVYNAGGPVTIVNTATVDNLAGPDPNAGNDSASETTKVIAVADLAVNAFATVTPPSQVVIGQTLDVTLRDTVSNNGPSSPMDATLVTTATANPGASVTPSSSTRSVNALSVGSPRSTDSVFTIGCSRPGFHTYRFTDTIAPTRADDIDPNPANNQLTTEFTLDCVVPVAVNISPGGNPNSINIPNDTVPLAVLTTRAGEYGLPLDFDARTIQPLTVHFGPRLVVYLGIGGSTEIHETGHIEDAYERTTTKVENVKDGDLDMVLHFASATSGLTTNDVEACVKGSFTDPATFETFRFFGCDVVRIVKPKK